MWLPMDAGCLKKLYNDIPNVTMGWVLRKRLHMKAYKLFIVQHLERWTVCMSLSVKVFVTLAIQQHLEYNCKALFETPCIYVYIYIYRSRKPKLRPYGIRRADYATPLYQQKMALTSPRSGGHSVGIVSSRTEATELLYLYMVFGSICKTSASFQHNFWRSLYSCWANFDLSSRLWVRLRLCSLMYTSVRLLISQM
jgi:hypothetical protein